MSEGLDDIFFTTAELAARWRMKRASLDNARSRGEGIPYVKPKGAGRVLYRLSDVLEAERAGTHGLTLDSVMRALATISELSGGQKKFIAKRLQAALTPTHSVSNVGSRRVDKKTTLRLSS